MSGKHTKDIRDWAVLEEARRKDSQPRTRPGRHVVGDDFDESIPETAAPSPRSARQHVNAKPQDGYPFWGGEVAI